LEALAAGNVARPHRDGCAAGFRVHRSRCAVSLNSDAAEDAGLLDGLAPYITPIIARFAEFGEKLRGFLLGWLGSTGKFLPFLSEKRFSICLIPREIFSL
jgi:hypothetical protein